MSHLRLLRFTFRRCPFLRCFIRLLFFAYLPAKFLAISNVASLLPLFQRKSRFPLLSQVLPPCFLNLFYPIKLPEIAVWFRLSFLLRYFHFLPFVSLILSPFTLLVPCSVSAPIPFPYSYIYVDSSSFPLCRSYRLKLFSVVWNILYFNIPEYYISIFLLVLILFTQEATFSYHLIKLWRSILINILNIK